MFSVFGSAGDLFPSVAVAQELERRGHGCIAIAPRSIALAARQAGLRTATLGSGRELIGRTDQRLLTNRFSGFSAWRRAMNEYVAPYAQSAIDRALRIATEFEPDLVVTHAFCGVGPIVSAVLGIPSVSIHAYPQLICASRRTHRNTAFAPSLAAFFRQCERRFDLAPRATPSLAYGISASTLVIHDRALLGDEWTSTDCEFVGYPLWDNMPSDDEQTIRAISFAEANAGELIIISLGSFLGLGRRDVLRELAALPALRGRPKIIAGAHPADIPYVEAATGIVALDFVPLTRLLPYARLAIHPGGTGMTYSAVHAGVPSAFWPLTFDHLFNARNVEDKGAGLLALDGGGLNQVVADVLKDSSYCESARSLADELTSVRSCVERITDAILGACL